MYDRQFVKQCEWTISTSRLGVSRVAVSWKVSLLQKASRG